MKICRGHKDSPIRIHEQCIECEIEVLRHVISKFKIDIQKFKEDLVKEQELSSRRLKELQECQTKLDIKNEALRASEFVIDRLIKELKGDKNAVKQ